MTVEALIRRIVENQHGGGVGFTARSVARVAGADVKSVAAVLERLVREGFLRASVQTPSNPQALPYRVYRVRRRLAKDATTP